MIFLVDGRDGLTPQDAIIADLLRRSGRPVVLAVNKAEGLPPERTVAEFHELGLGDPVAISSAHGENVRPLIEYALDLRRRGERRGVPQPRHRRTASARTPSRSRSSAGPTSASRRSSTRCWARSA